LITRDTITKILDTAQIEQVVGDFVNLKKAGSVFKGNCPFHQEKTPSFVVNPSKNIFKCFGCGKGGDSVTFIMEHEKFSFPEALRYLAGKYHIEIEETAVRTEDKQAGDEKESLLIALSYAAKFYQAQLKETEDGKAIGLSYFRERGFREDSIDTFQLGYAPDAYDTFYSQAIKDGYNTEILLKAGLIKEKNGKHYDFFRDRVMFPIFNVSGKAVAFGGRLLGRAKHLSKPDAYNPKYINTSETEVYHKGRILYGISHAKADIRKEDVCFLVEGYTDVISLHQSGIRNVVASSGTALTKEQVQLIKRFTQNIVILYDGDAAGVKAALRGLDIVLEQGLNVKLVLLPDDEDPDSFVRKNGTDATLSFIQKNQHDFILFKAMQGIKDIGNDPVRKSEVIRDIVQSIAFVQDNIKRALYIKHCAEIVDVAENILVNETNKIRTQQLKKSSELNHTEAESISEYVKTPEIHDQQISKTPLLYYQEKDIIRILLEYGDKEMTADQSVGEYVIFELVDIEFKNDVFGKIMKLFIDAYQDQVPFEEIRNINAIADKEIKDALVEILSTPYELSPNWFDRHEIIVKEANRTYKTDVVSVLQRFHYFKLMEVIGIVDEKIKAAEQNGNAEEMEAALRKKMELMESRKKLAKEIQTVIHPH
jgi:DNA primase